MTKKIYRTPDGVSRAIERGKFRFIADYPRRKRNLVLRLMDGPQTLAELARVTDLQPSTVRVYLSDIELQTGLVVRREHEPTGSTYWIEW
jgi:intein-encoded DNA endonuclease-like protein